MFEIEKNVPLPPARIRDGVATEMRKVLPTMKVGESFFVPDGKRDSIRVTIFKWAKENAPDKKFTARRADGGIRVWRVQ